MFTVAQLSTEERNELFSETASDMSLHPAIVHSLAEGEEGEG